MDQAASQRASIAQYGGSDTASPSFNRPSYVLYTSVNHPKDFGSVRQIDLDIEGVVGAESGSQTLFFTFTTLLLSRITLRRVLLNPYTDQYVSVSLRNNEGSVLLSYDGFSYSLPDSPASLGAAPVPIFDLGYVSCGYWVTGYGENDCQQTSPRATPVGSGGAAALGVELASASTEIVPPGPYRVVVSSSEWPQLPYRFLLNVGLVGELSGASDLQDQSRAQLGLTKPVGEARLRLVPMGALVRSIALEGTATSQAVPSGTVTRTSPYGT